MLASIRQASASFGSSLTEIEGSEVGHVVDGEVADVHKDNVVLTLKPSQIRALLSLANLANHRGSTISQLRASLKKGQMLQGLVIVSRNAQKGFVIVASKARTSSQIEHKGAVSWDVVHPEQIVGGRVVGHSHRGATVKLGPNVTAILHSTDCLDDYDAGQACPAINTILKATVLSVDQDNRQIYLSTRPSRMHADEDRDVVDREVNNVREVKEGETIRGFVKSVAEHGLFVSLGRTVDARVQIKELFDDVSRPFAVEKSLPPDSRSLLQYVKDWKPHFKANQLVKGRILRYVMHSVSIAMLLTPSVASMSRRSKLR
jgi:rRNA biogenesis protein RRP5